MCNITVYIMYSIIQLWYNFVARALLGKRRQLCKHYSGAVSLHKSTLQQGQICEVVCTNKQGGTVIIESEVRGKMDCFMPYVLTILCCIAYL